LSEANSVLKVYLRRREALNSGRASSPKRRKMTGIFRCKGKKKRPSWRRSFHGRRKTTSISISGKKDGGFDHIAPENLEGRVKKKGDVYRVGEEDPAPSRGEERKKEQQPLRRDLERYVWRGEQNGCPILEGGVEGFDKRSRSRAPGRKKSDLCHTGCAERPGNRASGSEVILDRSTNDEINYSQRGEVNLLTIEEAAYMATSRPKDTSWEKPIIFSGFLGL